MKICSRCKQSKKLEEFGIKKRAKDGKQYVCFHCMNKDKHDWYLLNKEKHNARIKITNAKNRKNNHKNVLNFLSIHPCIDCGNKNVLVLEFDHKGKKEKNILEMLSRYSWIRISKEIEKCEVRCANCHRIKTAKQLGSYRLLIEDWSNGLDKFLIKTG